MTPRTLVLCAVALACKARTDLHYSLPLTVADVGVAGCTTTWSFADRHSRPGPVLESRYFRASLRRYLRPKPKNREAELAWIDRNSRSGETPWSRSFPAVTDG